jgi:predicted  nucleic acid-binding Zn-ribbon protein
VDHCLRPNGGKVFFPGDTSFPCLGHFFRTFFFCLFQNMAKLVKDANPSPEMQARIRHLETEISRLRDSGAEVVHLKSGLEARVTRDEQLEASEKQLQKQVEELQAKPSEFEDKFVRLLGELTKAKVVLPAELSAARPRGVAQQREAQIRYKKIRNKCHHYKWKAKSLRKQLALVPWFGHVCWGRGANLGFETFRVMVKKSDFKFDPDFASDSRDHIPDLAAHELLTIGKKFFPDVPEWGENALKPNENANVSEPSSEFTPGTENESSEGEDS